MTNSAKSSSIHKTGAIKKAETITDANDLKNAKEQSQAMVKAKVSLDKAVADATKVNSGYRAVSVAPALNARKPVANITLMKGENVKKAHRGAGLKAAKVISPNNLGGAETMRLRVTRSRTRETDLEDLEVLERVPLGRQGERK